MVSVQNRMERLVVVLMRFKRLFFTPLNSIILSNRDKNKFDTFINV